VVSLDTRSERRFDLHTTVGNLKTKLELITGIPVQNQAIAVYNSEDDVQPYSTLDDDERLLGYYNLRDWQFLKVFSLRSRLAHADAVQA
jgi:tubulin-folding cofactor B